MGSFEGNYVLNWTPDGKGLTDPWQGSIEGQPNRKVFNLWDFGSKRWLAANRGS